MKLLFDVGVGKNVENHFSEAGFDVMAVRQLNPSLPDIDILAMAQVYDRIIVTMDKDFGDLIFHTTRNQYNPGVILLRMDDATTSEKIEALNLIFYNHGTDLAGHFSVYKKGQLRIR